MTELLNSHEEIEYQKLQVEEKSNDILNRNKVLAEQGYLMIQLAKSEFVQKGNLKGALEEISRTVSLALDISRVSVWEFQNDSMFCMATMHRMFVLDTLAS